MRDHSFGENKTTIFDKIIFHFRKNTVLKNTKTLKPKIIIDLGCGFNADLISFLKKYFSPQQAIGVDLSINKTINHIIPIEQNLEDNLKLDDSLADLIICTAVIEHLNKPLEFLQEVKRVLKPGGLLLITVPTVYAKPILEIMAKLKIIDENEIKDHKCYYKKNQMEKILTESGFELNKINAYYFGAGLNLCVLCQK
ncbi:MAG: class I SAM-dependent methyltransferase [Candidatus Magasanikiibacteriota bacterium]